MSKPKMTVTTDFTKTFNETVERFKNDSVLIGIPEEDTERTQKEIKEEPITNAAILAINTFGSPANNIPAWPVLAIGIRNAADQIADEFKKAAQGALKKGFSALDVYYNRAGIIASNSVKKSINLQEDAPALAPSTLAARRARGFKGDKRLIVTGQMRNAVTYVLNSGKKK